MVPIEPLADITEVEVIGDYRPRLTFEDGTVGDVDFTGRGVARRLRTASRSPVLRTRGSRTPEAGTLIWPDGVDMAPEPLYAEARPHLVRNAEAAS